MPSLFSLGAFSLLAASFLPGAHAQLNKTIMDPAVPFDQMDTHLYANLPPTAATWEEWEYGWLPARCHDVAEAEGHSPEDMTVYNVTYSDCDRPWIMCRHKDAPMSLDNLIDNFGRLPVRMRNLVRTQLAFPERSEGSLLAYTYTDLGDIVYTGDMYAYIRFWIHEVGHIRDAQVDPSAGDYSATTEWLDEYNKDAFICDAYAQTNAAENFAQEVVVAEYDSIVPGGIASLVPNHQDIIHQYTAIETLMGDELYQGGVCERLFEDDRLVCVGPDAGCVSAREYLVEREERMRKRATEKEPRVCEFEV
ncbi:uncharacterized protein BDV14DRAFT_202759 [Aspergillus stella-maris]|uniref:uncharacterized protein n=1 Tax=Aspergillus stella-maris TaxID=1810926 RepID=UPI003CCC95E2